MPKNGTVKSQIPEFWKFSPGFSKLDQNFQWGLSNRKLQGIRLPFLAITMLANLVFQLGHFVSKSFAQCITPSWELQTGNEAYGGSPFFVKVSSMKMFDHFLIERPPRMLLHTEAFIGIVLVGFAGVEDEIEMPHKCSYGKSLG